MEDHRVEEVYNDKQYVLLDADNIDIIIGDAISQGMLQRQDGKKINHSTVSDDDKYELMVHFVQFIIDHQGKDMDSRFIIAKA